MGYNIGLRLIDEFLAKSGVNACQDFRDTCDVIAKATRCVISSEVLFSGLPKGVEPKIGGTLPPKSSILIGFGTIINHPFWDFPPIFGNTEKLEVIFWVVFVDWLVGVFAALIFLIMVFFMFTFIYL